MQFDIFFAIEREFLFVNLNSFIWLKKKIIKITIMEKNNDNNNIIKIYDIIILYMWKMFL